MTLWTMQQGHRRLAAEVAGVVDAWELRLYADGALFVWYASTTREEALLFAYRIYHDCVNDGWDPIADGSAAKRFSEV